MSGFQQRLLLLGIVAASAIASGQRLPQFGAVTPVAALVPAAVLHPVQLPCAKRDEPFDVEDYSGPFNQMIARFSQKVDRVTVHAPNHHTSLKPCSLSVGEKFRLFVNDSVDPVNFIGGAWDAGIGQLQHSDPSYGQGTAGFSKRLAAEAADNATGDFFGMFFYPTIFHQDPRYYRVGRGTAGGRLVHALQHSFVATSDSGKLIFNYSEWSTTITTKLVTNLYHPDNPRGFSPTAQRVAFSVANDMGWDVLREFWPEIAHKFKLPFRTHEEYDAKKQPTPLEPAGSKAIDSASQPINGSSPE
ncbi:MAG TPA: hypothetical protein VKD24_09750 [Candidatus Angelobacter sp.]|nr:hypothetical protein [Candidatus Angelobacter sp.]